MSKTISQFQEHAGGCVVKQRTLRCGREGNLFCMHLIDESAFLNFLLKKQTTAYPFRIRPYCHSEGQQTVLKSNINNGIFSL